MTLFILLLLQKTPLFTSHDGVSQGVVRATPFRPVINQFSSDGYIYWCYQNIYYHQELLQLFPFFIIVAYSAITIPLDEPTYVDVLVIVTIDPITSSDRNQSLHHYYYRVL